MIQIEEGKQHFKKPRRVREIHRSKYDNTVEGIVSSLELGQSVKNTVSRAVFSSNKKPVMCEVLTVEKLLARSDAKTLTIVQKNPPTFC